MIEIKLDRDYTLDKLYEIRSVIDDENHTALQKLNEVVDLIIQAPILDSKGTLPKIRLSR